MAQIGSYVYLIDFKDGSEQESLTKKELQDIYMNHTAYKSEEKEWAYEYLLHAMNDGLREVPDVEDNKQLKNVLKYFVALRKKLST